MPQARREYRAFGATFLDTAFGLEPVFPRVATIATLCYFDSVKSITAKISAVGDHMADVDRSLLRENLKLTFEQRAQKHLRALQMVEELRRAGKKLRQNSDGR